uniref:Myb-like domain-containing protein n=1 Tax=Setaria viridis TaxID=4556 RepID=A0A4U6UPR3_SETVI|nr:hypothetical protein SEVIR_5G273000v2 [Setaria viridis]
MDPSSKNFTNYMAQDSPNSESSGQISPLTPQSQFHFTSPNFMHNFNPFGFQGVQHQGSWPQPSPPSFQGFHLQESFCPSPTMQFGAAINRATTNTSSHRSESSSPCPTRQHEKEPVSIEESSNSSEEVPKRRTHINYTEEENLQLLSSWIHHSTDPINGTDRKGEYYWKDVAQEFNSNAPTNAHQRSVKQLKSHWDTEEETMSKEQRPEGQKKAKARLKGKGKDAAPSPLGNQPIQHPRPHPVVANGEAFAHITLEGELPPMSSWLPQLLVPRLLKSPSTAASVSPPDPGSMSASILAAAVTKMSLTVQWSHLASHRSRRRKGAVA